MSGGNARISNRLNQTPVKINPTTAWQPTCTESDLWVTIHNLWPFTFTRTEKTTTGRKSCQLTDVSQRRARESARTWSWTAVTASRRATSGSSQTMNTKMTATTMAVMFSRCFPPPRPARLPVVTGVAAVGAGDLRWPAPPLAPPVMRCRRRLTSRSDCARQQLRTVNTSSGPTVRNTRWQAVL